MLVATKDVLTTAMEPLVEALLHCTGHPHSSIRTASIEVMTYLIQQVCQHYDEDDDVTNRPR